MSEFTAAHSGQERKVLFEGKNKNGMIEGYSDNYIRVEAPYSSEYENRIVDWRI